MSVNRGKQFEDIVKGAFESVPDTHVKRLYDVQGGYLGVANECDFYVFKTPNLFLIECKSVHGNTLSISSNDPKRKYGAISNTQWEGMLAATMTKNVVAGVLCWWVDRDVTMFLPIETLHWAREHVGLKSIRYDFPQQTLDSSLYNQVYSAIPIEGKKKRVFFEYDMQKFLDFFN